MAFGALNTYLSDVYRVLGRDETQSTWNPDDLIRYINIARQEVAAQGQCIRRLSPVSGTILTIDVVQPGHGYTAPTVSITPPDAPSGTLPYPSGLQATAIAQQIGGQISNIGVNLGGAGYFEPAITINDPHGVGATAVAQISPILQTTFNQEVYRFADVPITSFPGVQSILSVRSVAVQWASWQWTCARVSFSKYQALIRQYVNSFNAPPVYCCQFGQGVDGTLHLFPRPDQNYQLQWDCLCLPTDLEQDTDFEAIPDPWRSAVQFYAGHLALLSQASVQPAFMPLALQYFNTKDGGLFGTAMRRARAFSNPGQVSSFYARV